jgi:hypothetical protein
MRRQMAAVLMLFAGVFPRSARADHCQTPRPLEALGSGFRVSISGEVATYDTELANGDYEGLLLGVGFEKAWLRLRALFPGYRLTRNDERFYGPGDLAAEVRVAALSDTERGLAAGPSLLLTAPTGNDADDGAFHAARGSVG